MDPTDLEWSVRRPGDRWRPSHCLTVLSRPVPRRGRRRALEVEASKLDQIEIFSSAILARDRGLTLAAGISQL